MVAIAAVQFCNINSISSLPNRARIKSIQLRKINENQSRYPFIKVSIKCLISILFQISSIFVWGFVVTFMHLGDMGYFL